MQEYLNLGVRLSVCLHLSKGTCCHLIDMFLVSTLINIIWAESESKDISSHIMKRNKKMWFICV